MLTTFRVFGLLFLYAQLALAQPTDLANTLNEADRMDAENKHREGLQLLEVAAKTNPNNFEITWRLSRHNVEVGMMSDKKERESYYQQGIDLAKKAVALDSTHVEGHLRWAVAAGRLADFKGGDEKIKLSREVKAEAEAVIKRDANHAGGNFILGRWHETIANLGFIKRTLVKMLYGGFPDASNEHAIKLMEKAAQSDPNFIEYRVYLGKTYIERAKNYAAARPQLQAALDLPAKRQNDPELKDMARELLDKIKDKK